MGLFLVVLTVLTTTVVMLLGTAATESKNAYRQQQLTDAKLTGMSAIDSFYGRLQTDGNFPGPNSPSQLRTDVNPSGATPSWFRLVDGNITVCAVDETKPCYQLRSDLATGARSPVVEVTAKVRYNCRGDNCNYAYFNQRLRAWQFTDFLFYTQFNVISPGFTDFYRSQGYFTWRNPASSDPCATNYVKRTGNGLSDNDCPMIAYTAVDTVKGPVYSADDFVLVCGNPSAIFGTSSSTRNVWSLPSDRGSPIRSAGDASIRGDSACPSFAQPVGQAATFALRMPAARTTFDQAVAITPPERNLPAGSRLTFSGQDVNWTSGSGSGSIKLANGQLITVDGSATITGGTFEGRASLFVRDRVTIQDSLTYTSALRDGAGNPTGSVLGINAGGDIVLRSQARSKPAAGCGAVPSSSAFELDAILISLGGTVFADGMQRVLSAGECAQVLRLRGAVATKYQGVYGLYDAGTGEALAGFTKDFSHDDRAVQDITYLPPYLVTPSGLQWVRLDLGEVYCDTATTVCP